MPAESILWLHASDFENALLQSPERNRPVLLDFYHPTCEGCRRLESEVYADPRVIEAVEQNVTPVRIITTEWDPLTTDIINCYISISSPTIQLLLADGTVSHYWCSAPRQTVLSGRQLAHTNRRVYVEANGRLTPTLFLAELFVGLGKAALKSGRPERAMQFFEKMQGESGAGGYVVTEANYWWAIASAKLSASV